MAKQYIVDYINEARGRGKTQGEIRMALSTQPGVTEADIVEGFAAVDGPKVNQPTPPPPAPVSTPPASTPGPQAGPPPNTPQWTPPASAPEAPTVPPPPVQPPTHDMLMQTAGLTPPPSPKSPVKRILLACIIVILLLAGAGLAVAQYTGAYSVSWLPVSSERLWKKFQGQTVAQAVSSDFSFSYTDAGLDGVDSPFGGALKNIKVEVKGNAYVNGAADLPGLESQSTVNYSLASGNTSFSTGIEYRIVGEALYLNIGQNPFLSAMMTGMNGEVDSKKYDWIKVGLDAKTLQKFKDEAGNTAEVNQLADQRYWQDLADKWKDQDFLDKPQYVGKEDLRGLKVLHYKTNVKKETVRELFNDFLGKLLTSQDKETKESAALFVNGLIDKVQIESVDIWVGQKDALIHKVTVKSNAPSVASFAKAMEDQSKAYSEQYNAACSDWSQPCNAPAQPSVQEQMKKLLAALQFSAQLNLSFEFFDYGTKQTIIAPADSFDITKGLDTARSSSRDAKRLADIRQMASAFELYFNDNSKYPGSLAEVTPTYLGIIPIPPEPVDGACTPQQNAYVYTVDPGQQNYHLTFCLGATTGGYPAGVHTLSSSGIQ